MTKFLLAGTAVALAATAAIAQTVAPASPAGRDTIHTRQTTVQRVQTLFAGRDANRDGYLTAEELRGDRNARPRGQRGDQAGGDRSAQGFARFDANKDGMISRAEWDARQAVRDQRRDEQARRGVVGGMDMGIRGRMFAAADANKDGKLSLQEATSAALQRFDKVDANRDGRVTPQERQQAREQRRS